MCKSVGDPGGPRRCSADSRGTYQRTQQHVQDLEQHHQALSDGQSYESRQTATYALIEQLNELRPGRNPFADYDFRQLAHEAVTGSEDRGFTVAQLTSDLTVKHERLDGSLANIPSLTDHPKPTNHTEASARLNERRDAALKVASNTLDQAARVNAAGDTTAADGLIDEARRYVAEAVRIDAKRVAQPG